MTTTNTNIIGKHLDIYNRAYSKPHITAISTSIASFNVDNGLKMSLPWVIKAANENNLELIGLQEIHKSDMSNYIPHNRAHYPWRLLANNQYTAILLKRDAMITAEIPIYDCNSHIMLLDLTNYRNRMWRIINVYY